MTGHDVLHRIVADRRRRVEEDKARRPLESLRLCVQGGSVVTRVEDAIRRGPPAFLCEVKRGSPSRGLLAPDLDPADLAGRYERGGADVISVVTEVDHFFAYPDMLDRVRSAVQIPILQKDFFVDAYQLVAARAGGADLVLFIVAALEDAELRTLLAEARSLGLEAIVEVHDEGELERAVEAGASILGINNRNLRDFEVDLTTTERLAPLVPADRVIIGESGIHGPDDVRRLRRAGVHGFLIGESLVVHPDPERHLAELRRAAWE